MIKIEKIRIENIDKLISWINSPEELMQFAGPNLQFPFTRSQFEEYSADKNRFIFSVFKENNDEHAEILLKENTFALGRILIGEQKNRGKGYGKLITQELLKFGFDNLDKNEAELNVFDWNIQAIKAYEKVGFKINPNQKLERELNGEIWTAINMTLKKT